MDKNTKHEVTNQATIKTQNDQNEDKKITRAYISYRCAVTKGMLTVDPYQPALRRINTYSLDEIRKAAIDLKTSGIVEYEDGTSCVIKEDGSCSFEEKCETEINFQTERIWNVGPGIYMSEKELPDYLKVKEPGFFDDRFIIIAPYLSGTGSVEVVDPHISIIDGAAVITIYIDIPLICTCDMASFVNIIALKRELLETYDHFTIRFLERHV